MRLEHLLSGEDAIAREGLLDALELLYYGCLLDIEKDEAERSNGDSLKPVL